jgi:hypothetical protein
VKVGEYRIHEYWTDTAGVRRYWAASAFGQRRKLFPFTEQGKAAAIAWAEEGGWK